MSFASRAALYKRVESLTRASSVRRAGESTKPLDDKQRQVPIPLRRDHGRHAKYPAFALRDRVSGLPVAASERDRAERFSVRGDEREPGHGPQRRPRRSDFFALNSSSVSTPASRSSPNFLICSNTSGGSGAGVAVGGISVVGSGVMVAREAAAMIALGIVAAVGGGLLFRRRDLASA